MKLAIRIAKCPDGYAAWCPALPGCAVRAGTERQAKDRIQDAVAGYLSSLDVALPRELGRKVRFEASLAMAGTG